MEKDKKIAQLQSILKERIKLKHIKRWKKVNVTNHDDTPQWIRQLTNMDRDSLVVHWNGRNKGNIHQYEIKEAKLKDIDTLILRNQERLKAERPIYK